MLFFLKKLILKPSHVSWLSFILLGLIVFGIGLSGTFFMIGYLYNQLTAFEIKHNQKVASSLILNIDSSFVDTLKDTNSQLYHDFQDYRQYGYKFFILDQIKQELVYDSEQNLKSPLPLNKSWLSSTTTVKGKKIDLLTANTKIISLDSEGQSVIIWLQKIDVERPGIWVLGVITDQSTFITAMQELKLHLDAIMLLIFILITVLGYFAMRSTGRIYEQSLETQLKERTNQLNSAHFNRLHESKLATIGKTATVLAHEMRNPLASIKLALSSLNSSDDLKEREKRRVNLVLGEVDRLNNLLSDTLDYAKPVMRSKKSVNLDLLLNQVLQQEDSLIKQKAIALKHTACSDCTSLRLDKSQFHQVILNLLKNALEASPNGGMIETSLIRDGNDVLFEMSNTGETLSKDVMKNAFEPFFTTKSKGTGLGLGLVKRVVGEHGGTVILENNDKIIKVILRVPLEYSDLI